jgi:hypothetical protein
MSAGVRASVTACARLNAVHEHHAIAQARCTGRACSCAKIVTTARLADRVKVDAVLSERLRDGHPCFRFTHSRHVLHVRALRFSHRTLRSKPSEVSLQIVHFAGKSTAGALTINATGAGGITLPTITQTIP